MKIHPCYAISSLCWQSIPAVKIGSLDKVITAIKFNTMNEMFHYDEPFSLWLMIINMMEINHWPKNSSKWWKLFKMRLFNIMEIRVIHYLGETVLLWWKFITVMNVIILIENSSLWWKTIALMKTNHSEKTYLSDENSTLWWKFITLMKIHHKVKIHHCCHISSLWWKFIAFVKEFILIKSNYLYKVQTL